MFKSDELIDEVELFVKSKRLPPRLKKVSLDVQNDFRKRASLFRYTVKDQLVLIETGHVVVRLRDGPSLLEQIYEEKAIGMGQIAFYKLVSLNYIGPGVLRSKIAEFLKGKTNYQLTRDPISSSTNHHIATYSRQVYYIDLVDMTQYATHNTNYKYILTIVDGFSGKVWLGKLLRKEPQLVANEFHRLVKDVLPKRIVADNGSEWKSDFADYCKEKKITFVNTSSYQPTANIAEHKNRVVRARIRAFWVRQTEEKQRMRLNWTRILDQVAESMNNTFNRNKKSTSNRLFDPRSTEGDDEDDLQLNTPINRERQREVERMIALQNENNSGDFQIGDVVRVSMKIYSGVRELTLGLAKQKLNYYTCGSPIFLN